MRKTTKTIALAIAITSSMQCFGWGQKGHDITCAIALRHMTPEAKAATRELLDGKSITYWSNWLDIASNTKEYAYTKTWHYRNVDIDQTWETAPDIETGNVITALNEQIAILKNPAAPRSERQFALKVIVHLMGDLHQPLHIGRLADRGGNEHKITFFNQPANLHGVWDTSILEAGHKWSHTEWAEEIDTICQEEVEDMCEGTISDWGKETYAFACIAYQETPEGSNISYQEVDKWTKVIELQLLRGGVRLAKILNKSYSPPSPPSGGM